MNKRFINYILLLFLSFVLPIRAIQFRHVSIHDGLSQISVLSIYQDRVGRMWFGTVEGLNLYDGNTVLSFKNMGDSDKYMGYSIRSIAGDDRNVYINASGNLFKNDIRTQKFTLLLTGINDLTYVPDNHHLYYAKSDVIYVMDTQTESRRKVCRVPGAGILTALLKDSHGRTWIGSKHGLYTLQHGRIKRLIPDISVAYLFEDSRHNLWISTLGKGCYVLHAQGGIQHFTSEPSSTWRSYYNISDRDARTSRTIASNDARGIAEDGRGHIWIGTFMGLNEYNPQTGLFTIYAHTNNPNSISHSSVFPIYKDARGTLWVGTYYGGVNYFNPEYDIFHFYDSDVNRPDCLSYPFVGHMIEDKDGNVWIGTEGGGLNMLDRKTGHIAHYLKGSSGIAENNVKDLAYDAKRNRLYVGTHMGGLSILDIPSQRFNNLLTLHPEYGKFGNRVICLREYGDYLYLTTESRYLFKLNLNTLSLTAILPKYHLGGGFFTIDAKGVLWTSDEHFVYGIDLKTDKIARRFRIGRKGLGENLQRFLVDRHGNLFITSQGFGLFRYDARRDTFLCYTSKNSGMMSSFCYDIVSCKDGVVVNTDKGICLFRLKDHTFRNIELSQDFPLTGIDAGCGLLVCQDGEIFAGGINGMVSFEENKLSEPVTDYQLYISSVLVNNRMISAQDGSGILDEAVMFVKGIALNYDENDITVNFTTNEYYTTGHRIYEYKLEGQDSRWHQTEERRIVYTKLPPGNYTLLIREKQDSETEKVHEARLGIHVHPPFYRSIWAYLVYLVLLIMGARWLYDNRRRHWQMEMALEQEKTDKKNIEQLNKLKLQFFTNISHELRTPLTLLIAKIDAYVNESQPGSSLQRKLKGLGDHANHLLELVNELLDFRKVDQGFIHLKVSEYDMVAFARKIFESFEEYAENKHIKYSFTSSHPSLPCWFDSKQMEKVIYNLLSNAFKYVRKENGEVGLQVLSENDHLYLKVWDNGVGISQKDISRIFDRFYQAENDISRVASSSGTGIGLALVKDIVQLHHGTVKVESSEGYGSVFIVDLPKGKDLYKEDEIQSQPTPSMGIPVLHQGPTVDPEDSAPLEKSDHSRYTILLVEDNEELLLTLQELFQKSYNVILARDGKEGLAKTRELKPDLIVSDIMMPVMNGTDMCKEIKNDITICHIPVILLTAMSSTEHTINGLKIGADDYISKPFDPRLLVARCNNLIRSRLLLQNKYNADDHSGSELLATNTLDQEFMRKCDAFIDQNMTNPDAKVEDIIQNLEMGRSTFFSKFKSLTGMTPNEYTLNYRLRRSAIWLKERKDLQIADIAYQLGFSTPRYFSQVFKKKYGLTPSEFRGKL
ncbi:MAG TPA: hybrid sensor histidine kinase/response regulator [Prevotella sp.]|nr:hybrid sensor histidine kinase/response regulator [Prevotella sp.]